MLLIVAKYRKEELEKAVIALAINNLQAITNMYISIQKIPKTLRHGI